MTITRPDPDPLIEDYLKAQDLVYPILKNYTPQEKYDFAVMFAAEMMFLALNSGKAIGYSYSEIFGQFSNELREHHGIQEDLNKFDDIVRKANGH